MKKLICAFLITTSLSNIALADCNFSTGITGPNAAGKYEYTKECHIKVGEQKRDLEISLLQNKKLIEAISLKDLALTKANERADLWMDTSFKLESRIETMEGLYNRNKYLYFGLGVLATGLAVHLAGQLRR